MITGLTTLAGGGAKVEKRAWVMVSLIILEGVALLLPVFIKKAICKAMDNNSAMNQIK